jgi:hypothetical protein
MVQIKNTYTSIFCQLLRDIAATTDENSSSCPVLGMLVQRQGVALAMKQMKTDKLACRCIALHQVS